MHHHIEKQDDLTIHVQDRNTLYSLLMALRNQAEEFDKAHDKLTGTTPDHEESRHLLDEVSRYFTQLHHELKHEFNL